MKQLLACPDCHRRLEAGSAAPGEEVSCPCGAQVPVPAQPVEGAEVVRCASCGGPRRQQEKACRFCQANFTLFERDLDTLCPGCAHRVSSKGRFCHHCGTVLLKGQAAHPATDRGCPACGPEATLRSRPLASTGMAALECVGCAGLWLDWEVFRHLEALMRQQASAPAQKVQKPSAQKLQRAQTGPLYRPCPACGQLMHRLNYGRGSGIVIDTCREHGAWFDHEELARVLAWVREGGEQRVLRRDREELEAARRLAATGRSPRGTGGSYLGALVAADLASDVFDF